MSLGPSFCLSVCLNNRLMVLSIHLSNGQHVYLLSKLVDLFEHQSISLHLSYLLLYLPLLLHLSVYLLLYLSPPSVCGASTCPVPCV